MRRTSDPGNIHVIWGKPAFAACCLLVSGDSIKFLSSASTLAGASSALNHSIAVSSALQLRSEMLKLHSHIILFIVAVRKTGGC